MINMMSQPDYILCSVELAPLAPFHLKRHMHAHACTEKIAHIYQVTIPPYSKIYSN